MKTTLSLSTLVLLNSLTIPAAPPLATAAPTPPLPTDLQLVPSDSLPGRGTTWWSVTRWYRVAPSPVNWLAGRTDVLYYRSPSFGTNKIIIDDTLVPYPEQPQAAAMSISDTQAPLGPAYGPNDIWLEIQFDTNAANQVDILLHGATNGAWQLLGKNDLASTNAWQVVEIQIDDGSTNILHFGPFSDLNPPANFFRAELTSLFIRVATNLPSPVGIDYHPPSNALILSINFDQNDPAFGMLGTNASLTPWSGIGGLEVAYEIRLATVKSTANGFTNGDLFFSSSGSKQGTDATVGWLSADGTTSNLNWVRLSGDFHMVEDLHIDQTGFWNHDLLVATSEDEEQPLTAFKVWRVHSPTDFHLVTTNIMALHLEGLLTLPNDSRYGPWAGKLLTADQNTHAIFAVATNGIVTTNYLSMDIDGMRLIPTNQDLYCVNYLGRYSELLKVPRQFFNHSWGDILMEQSGETGTNSTLFIVHWDGTNFNGRGINLSSYYNTQGFFQKVAFAPFDLPPQ